MKNTFLVLSIAGIAMSSCAKTDVMNEASETQTGKIAFESSVNKATRAGEVMDNNSLKTFYVSGSYYLGSEGSQFIQLFNKEAISKNEKGEWIQAGSPRYWVKDATYNFYAFSKNNGDCGGDARYDNAAAVLTITNYDVDGTHNQEDLIYSAVTKITGKETGNDPVSFTFTHLLSKMKFTFQSEFAAGYEIKISNFKITGVRSRASYTSGATWVFARGTGDSYVRGSFEPTFKEGKNIIAKEYMSTAEQTISTPDMYMLPWQYEEANVRISFDIDVYNLTTAPSTMVFGTNITTSLKPNWQAGHSYNYKINLKGSDAGLEQIKFKPSEIGVEGWQEETIEITFGAN